MDTSGAFEVQLLQHPLGKMLARIPLPRLGRDSLPPQRCRKKQEMHSLPISLALVKGNRKLLAIWEPGSPWCCAQSCAASGSCCAGTATPERGSAGERRVPLA